MDGSIQRCSNDGWCNPISIEREHADSIEEQPVTPYSRYQENREID
jgi:hypothetical protein